MSPSGLMGVAGAGGPGPGANAGLAGLTGAARAERAGKGGSGTSPDTLSSFRELLSGAMETVNDLQMNADRMSRQLATGEIRDIHRVMIAVEEANIALELTVQIRNKIVDAYQEIMRMQV